MNKIGVGDKVRCRLYNWPERKFYGPHFTGVIMDIKQYDVYGNPGTPQSRGYRVKRDDTGYIINLARKEIKGRAK